MIMNHKKLYQLYTEEKLGQAPKGAEKGPRVANAYARGSEAGQTLVARLTVRHVRSLAPVPHPGGER